MLSRYCNNMHFPHHLFIFVFLTTLLPLSVLTEYSTEAYESYDFFDDIRKTLINHEDTLSKDDEKQNTSSPSIPNIIGRMINILNCGSFPYSPNSHLKYSLDYSAKSLLLFQECDRYFKTTQETDSLQVQCKYKNWIFNKINCQITTCPPLTAPTGGHISTNDHTYNTTVYFWCDRGFSIKGADKLICKENGVWNMPPPTCNVSYCRPLLSPIYGFVSSRKKIAVNQTVKFSCKNKYSIVGDAILRCVNDGRWNTSAPVCKKMCIVPDITNRTEGVRLIPEFKKLSTGSLVYQSQRVIFSCKPGYNALSGLSTCIGGFWRPSISCRKVCSVVKVNNGTYILSKDSSTIEYSCQPGFQLVGQRKLLCTSNLTWDNEAPICTKMCTLPELHEVLSFRDKKTYEIIPFGTQIKNGKQVHSVFRFDTTLIVTECFNGQLYPVPSRIRDNVLEIFFKDDWCQICGYFDELCKYFKYEVYSGSVRCDYCWKFDFEEFRETKKIVLSSKHYDTRCVACH